MGRRGWLPTGIAGGAAWAVLTAALCLAFAAWRDAPTVSLAAVTAAPESALMSSCDPSPAAPSSGETLLWCADPSSPQCIPAAPSAPHIELADRPDAALTSSHAVTAAAFVVVPFPSIEPDRDRGMTTAQRLERPPRG